MTQTKSKRQLSDEKWESGLSICEALVSTGLVEPKVTNELLAASVGISPQAMHKFTEKALAKVKKKLLVEVEKDTR